MPSHKEMWDQVPEDADLVVIGGGITGAVAASRIADSLSNVSIELFDQGRRGPGGRASHRR